ncbi:MAG: thioredoxin domain-containing protein [Bacteroidetes bacterium]|nr:thioredoxin domain-containing protein [Bacteroidota bacterium]
MTNRLSTLLLSAVLLAGFQQTACGQAPSGDDARKARIAANIRFSIPQLAEVQVNVVSIEPGTGTYDRGVVNLAGQQNVNFIVSKDDTELYLLATDVIDASRSEDEIAALKAEQQAQEGQAALERGAMLAERSASSPSKGKADAPITIVEFSDFQCPYCARATETVKNVMTQYGNEVRLVYLQLPLESLHPWALDASVAAVCAAEQDDTAFWTLHDYYFANQKDITKQNLKDKSASALASTEVDEAKWAQCFDDKATLDKVREEQQLGQSLGITGTPAFFVNGRPIQGAQPIEDFHEAIRLARMDAAETK